MTTLAWYVRTVRTGDSHLADADWNGSRLIRPICAPEAEFRAMNRRPMRVCFYDEQRCPLCLRHASALHAAPVAAADALSR
ncbi:hypothetical protein FHR81_000797 [Actinoalloteichus hoggarensis]|uniref:Uncharacterized protein n=1 Tax=Actinoalloteichus hoggarensis TaxID=1470176 RepID=A0A221W150_9PSEU|nr:hypothetical protein [Actinoalloteichus hoggarensis]ASO19525.1 hypothetical protein AHOG_09405 [Actinoalloteichus hoggarensis]MBB5919768.1 hypothetical protein [Actinoalloteichus hoggarensis]